VNGTPIKRPRGQARRSDGAVSFGPSTKLDIEAELGFVVGVGTEARQQLWRWLTFAKHVFGVCLLNDWSARDIQAWEYVPLGPFLGKVVRHQRRRLDHPAGGAR